MTQKSMQEMKKKMDQQANPGTTPTPKPSDKRVDGEYIDYEEIK